MSTNGQVQASGLTITVQRCEASHASLDGFHVSRERRSLWDQQQTAVAMAEVLAAGQCDCVEAVHERGMNTNVFGYGFLLLPQALPVLAQELFGVQRLVCPRLVVIVNSALRGQGLGSEMTRQLLRCAKEHGCTVVEVEADAEQREFFEGRLHFAPVEQGVRQHYLGQLVLLRHTLE